MSTTKYLNKCPFLVSVSIFFLLALGHGKTRHRRKVEDLSLWIDENQVKLFSGLRMEIFAIADGHVLPYILDPNFEEYLPIIPSDVSYVNFTWKSGKRKYEYNFDRLQSFNEDILQSPFISVETKGEVPKKPQMFTLYLPCSGNVSGIASFGIGLMIQTRRGKSLPGTPLRLRLRKECSESLYCCLASPVGPDPECDRKCANGGWCNHEKFCQCPEGYMGKYCMTALCYPQCMNGGTCTAPGVCSCPPGYQGRHCEGGICSRKCLNRGKCIQKDTCACRKGYYGERCEFSKCVIPCLNGGRCRGANICKCPPGFKGSHCEITPNYKKMAQQHSCHKPCHHGYCLHGNRCNCKPGWHGRYCQHRVPGLRSGESTHKRRHKERRLHHSRKHRRRRKLWV